MEIIKLSRGEMAAEDTDCIKINELADGTFSLVASALVRGEGGADESAALVSGDPYPTFDAAEAAGLAWASAQGVVKIFVETGGSAEPILKARRG